MGILVSGTLVGFYLRHTVRHQLAIASINQSIGVSNLDEKLF
jgi:hypothetical protein